MGNLFANIDSYDFGEAYYKYYGSYGPIMGPSIQLVAMKKGNGIVSIDGIDHILKANTISLIIAQHSLAYLYPAEEDHQVSWCVASVKTDRARDDLEFDQAIISLAYDEKMELLFSMGLEIAYTGDISSIAHRNSLGKAVYFEFLKASNVSNGTEQIPSAVRKCLAYIDNNLSTDMTVTVISQHVNLSQDYINNLFKKAVGLTISQYIWKKRQERSVELLKNSDYPILEISEQCGFKNQQHFSRFIKQAYDQTPSEIRKTAQRKKRSVKASLNPGSLLNTGLRPSL